MQETMFILGGVLAAAAALSLFLNLRRKRRWIVVDGSNVLHWKDETPMLSTVANVVEVLQSQGFTPVIWFDANVGYKVSDRYMGPRPLSRAIGVPQRQVFVAPKGIPADPLLLEGAERLRARVVTNDRFRDWAETYPKVEDAGFLIAGRVQGGEIGLRLGEG
jgi:hypothetical protein